MLIEALKDWFADSYHPGRLCSPASLPPPFIPVWVNTHSVRWSKRLCLSKIPGWLGQALKSWYFVPVVASAAWASLNRRRPPFVTSAAWHHHNRPRAPGCCVRRRRRRCLRRDRPPRRVDSLALCSCVFILQIGTEGCPADYDAASSPPSLRSCNRMLSRSRPRTVHLLSSTSLSAMPQGRRQTGIFGRGSGPGRQALCGRAAAPRPRRLRGLLPNTAICARRHALSVNPLTEKGEDQPHPPHIPLALLPRDLGERYISSTCGYTAAWSKRRDHSRHGGAGTGAIRLPAAIVGAGDRRDLHPCGNCQDHRGDVRVKLRYVPVMGRTQTIIAAPASFASNAPPVIVMWNPSDLPTTHARGLSTAGPRLHHWNPHEHVPRVALSATRVTSSPPRASGSTNRSQRRRHHGPSLGRRTRSGSAHSQNRPSISPSRAGHIVTASAALATERSGLHESQSRTAGARPFSTSGLDNAVGANLQPPRSALQDLGRPALVTRPKFRVILSARSCCRPRALQTSLRRGRSEAASSAELAVRSIMSGRRTTHCG